MPKSLNKTSTSGNSHSYIFSDVSKAIYREEAINRKIKHIQQENMDLEESIRGQQEQIKDERTIIIYQMGELAKAVNGKLNVFQDYEITKEMFGNEQRAHSSLKQLMQKFQAIEKEERMMDKVRNSIQKIFQAYTQHKQSIQNLMNESSQNHRDNQQKLKQIVEQKRIQLTNVKGQNVQFQQEIQRMKIEMFDFEQDEPELEAREKILRKQIGIKENLIKNQSQKFEEISKWTDIVVDKRHRYELSQGIKEKRKELMEIQNQKGKIEIALKEATLAKNA